MYREIFIWKKIKKGGVLLQSNRIDYVRARLKNLFERIILFVRVYVLYIYVYIKKCE